MARLFGATFVRRAESIALAAEGQVKAQIQKAPPESINDIFDALKAGEVEGRLVPDLA